MNGLYMDYHPKFKVRIVTAASLFDGHDAAINIMRRIMQSMGAEIIHLGHNRSVAEIVECAIEEDVQGIAITSYQGGHLEFFKYMKDLLDQNGSGHIKIFGGGGGTILPQEITDLHHYGITRIFSPDDGRRLGLEGMIESVIRACDFKLNGKVAPLHSNTGRIDTRRLSRQITNAENGLVVNGTIENKPSVGLPESKTSIPVLGITGTGGAGKSSVTDEIVRRFLQYNQQKTIAVISVDPSKKKTGGALLGDRIRMNAISGPRSYMRSLATRQSDQALSKYVGEAIDACKAAGFDFIILESAGVGQSDTSILDYCNTSLYVMTPEYGAASQLEKINMLDYADLIAINKFDKAGSLDALSDVKKQYKRNHKLWTARDEDIPVLGTIASQFNDAGINMLYGTLVQLIAAKTNVTFESGGNSVIQSGLPRPLIIPSSRTRYLSEISEHSRQYNLWITDQSTIASNLYQLNGTIDILNGKSDQQDKSPGVNEAIESIIKDYEKKLSVENLAMINDWPSVRKMYRSDYFEYLVREQVIRQPLSVQSLSGTRISKVVLPSYQDWGDILKWQLQENLPGKFPYTAGVFELKRTEEDPTRMFAGEGGPERTNKRFHYVSLGQPAIRLSTAFDSVTLYGEDPDPRPDIFGKIGNSGVSVATIDDAKKLYSGFDLSDAKTSVSMTINGPAPVLLAFYLNAAIDQQCELWLNKNGDWEKTSQIIAGKFRQLPKPGYYNPAFPERLPEGNNGLGLRLLGLSGDEVIAKEIYKQIKASTLASVRGTVQADILKEDQAQNTCIFSTEFALKLMGDVQEYFITNRVRNFYSVSISGYHIAEAGANPVTQLAFTLANGFTYVEYYLSRGMQIDEFAPNLSFFFSNGMDAEYSVIGRVARRIWARAIRFRYNGNERSQKLKYHIQTSGRSLHAQEIDFNDIRTTLQALYAIYDNCNSLHTNAYDEAITTPTEESVRRAMAIQLIINRELGSAKTENFIQGSFAVEELTDLVEEAVLMEFDRLTERGGVLGAMERMYQRNKIQEESLQYETLKHTGELPIVGVNTFLNKKGSPTVLPGEVIRSTTEEKEQQIQNLRAFKKRNEMTSAAMLDQLKKVALQNGNIFAELMETVKYCSLGEITHALYEVGGQYRRSM
jgi:methylmalonyl-CoA mutase